MRTTRGMLVGASLVLGLGLVGCGGDAETEAPLDGGGTTEAPIVPGAPDETDDGLPPTDPMDPGTPEAPDGGTEPTDPGTVPETEPDTGTDTDG